MIPLGVLASARVEAAGGDTLEDIAGVPVLDTTTPLRGTHAGTVIAVGIYSDMTGGAYLLQGAAGTVGVQASEWWTSSGAHVRGQTGSVWWAYVHSPGDTGIGRRRLSTIDSWVPGPFRAVAYDRTLTEQEAADVVAFLAAELERL